MSTQSILEPVWLSEIIITDIDINIKLNLKTKIPTSVSLDGFGISQDLFFYTRSLSVLTSVANAGPLEKVRVYHCKSIGPLGHLAETRMALTGAVSHIHSS